MAEATRKANYRARGTGAKGPVTEADWDDWNAGAFVPESEAVRAKSPGPSRMGDAEAAVIAECERLPLAAERPTAVVGARLMARIIDNPEWRLMHGKAAAQMEACMGVLRPKPSKRKTGRRLASVQSLTKEKR
jgi:hypothetical protein